MCSCESRPSSSSGGSKVSSKQSCSSCTVTMTPKPLNICGARTTENVTATGSPAGGSFAWRSSDTGVATVSGTGNAVSVRGVAAGRTTLTVTYNVSGCTPCTDNTNVNVCTCTAGRKYAYAQKSVANLIGIKARIKTRYGKVCCEDEGCSRTDAYHCVYVNISRGGSWAQTGFERYRNAGSTTIVTARYAEMNGATYRINNDTRHAPAEGTTHEYKCDLVKSTGTWRYSYDGTVWQTYADNNWRGNTGTVAQWVGEIYNREDDMPGTGSNKCNFTSCQYRRDGHGYRNAGLTVGDMVTDDASQWGVERVSGTALNIWDKNPLP